MSEINDLANNLISILESMNMKSTADSFKLEFTSKIKEKQISQFQLKPHFKV